MPYREELTLARYLTGCLFSLCKKALPELSAGGQHIEVLLSLRIFRAGGSILRLLAPAQGEGDLAPHADLASIASVARMLIETSLNFFFLCAEETAPDEREFRRLAVLLHYGEEMLRLEREFSAGAQLSVDAAKVQALRDRLSSHPFAGRLSPSELKRALSGRQAIYVDRSGLSVRMGLPPTRLAAIYRVFSGYIHASTLSLHMDLTRFTDQSTMPIEASAILFHINTFVAKQGLYLLQLFPDRELEHPPDYVEIATAVAGRKWESDA